MTTGQKRKTRRVTRGLKRPRKHSLRIFSMLRSKPINTGILKRLVATLSDAEAKHLRSLLFKRLPRPLSAGQTSRHFVQAIPLQTALERWEFLPQAVVARPLESFAAHVKSNISTGQDALDEYSGIAFAIDGTPFTVMHYRGHPPHTSTIYLPREVVGLPEITKIIAQIVTKFEVPTESVIWQRKDNPEL